MALVYGFAGLRDDKGRISFQPRLPKTWSSIAFCLSIGGRRLRIELDRDGTKYQLLEGAHLEFGHAGQAVILTASEPAVEIATTVEAKLVGGHAPR